MAGPHGVGTKNTLPPLSEVSTTDRAEALESPKDAVVHDIQPAEAPNPPPAGLVRADDGASPLAEGLESTTREGPSEQKVAQAKAFFEDLSVDRHGHLPPKEWAATVRAHLDTLKAAEPADLAQADPQGRVTTFLSAVAATEAGEATAAQMLGGLGADLGRHVLAGLEPSVQRSPDFAGAFVRALEIPKQEDVPQALHDWAVGGRWAGSGRRMAFARVAFGALRGDDLNDAARADLLSTGWNEVSGLRDGEATGLVRELREAHEGTARAMLAGYYIGDRGRAMDVPKSTPDKIDEALPVLRQKAAAVKAGTPELRALVARMVTTMYAENGVGLAAPQVGESKQVFVMDWGGLPKAFINPTIVERSDQELPGLVTCTDGCLSVNGGGPGNTHRAEWIVLEAQDIEGNDVRIRLEGKQGWVVQHEVDHLNGVLFFDHHD